MKNRVISYGLDARTELAKGADFLAECVKRTLGPYGQNWFLDKKNSITNDGVTVANEIQLTRATKFPDGTVPNELNNRGATALREAANKTVDEVGDGTTTAIILAQGIYHEASRFLESDGVTGKKTPAEIRNQIEEERKLVTDKLTAMATPVDTEEKLVNSATVSMGDKTIGKLIGEAQWKLGKDGVLIPEESNDPVCAVNFVKGISIDNGLGTGTLINNPEKQTMEVDDTKIILTTYTIKTPGQFQKYFEKVLTDCKNSGIENVTIVARAWTEETLQLCLLNIQRGAVKVYPVNAPYVNMREKMKDLAAITGATFYDSDSTRLEDLRFVDLGYAKKVIARRMDSLITGDDDKATQVRVAERIKELEQERGATESDFERKHLSERIAQLNGGFAVVKVGAESNMERRRLFDKVDDAVHAVRAAFQEGTVQGGGLAFLEIAKDLPDTALLKRPLMAINQQIMGSAPKGFKVEDWVRDPVKVLRVALEHACAAATSFAMAGGVVTEKHPESLDMLFGKQMQQNEAAE